MKTNRMIPIITLAFALLLSGFTPELSHAAGNKKTRKTSRAPVARNDKSKRKSKERTATTRKDGRAPLIFDVDRDRLADRFDQPEEAIQWYLEKRLPKGEKYLPVDRYFAAKEKVKRMKRYSTAKGKLMPSQAEAGDTGDDGQFPNGTGGGGAGDGSSSTSGVLGTWQSLGPGNVGGRTRALLIDPTNPDVMYAAAVAGGIWKTTNGGIAWVPLNDFLANIAVTCMAMDPTNPNIIYAGTGEGFFNADGVRGAGIFKTTDAGANWTRLAATASNSDFFFVNDVVVSPADAQHVYAATRTGVWRSLDGGASWTQVLASNVANGANGAMDLVMRTDAVGQTTDYIFAAVGTFARSHIWRNTNAGGSGVWEDVYSEANMGRTSLAIAPSNQSVIYAMATCIACGAGTNPNFPALSYTDGLLAVFRSTANGDAASWTTQVRNNSANLQDTLLLSNPVNGALTQCGIGASQMLNQGWYDNVLAVDPTDPNTVLVAAKDWRAGTKQVWHYRSTDGGTTWADSSLTGLPADLPNQSDPVVIYDADGVAYTSIIGYNDSDFTRGGLYVARSTDNGATWTSHTRVTDFTSNPNYEQFSNRTVPFAGDYLWVTSLGDFSFGTWTDWRNTVQGVDPREVTEDEDNTTADVKQCRTFANGAWSGDQCPHDGGLDQDIYGDYTP